MIIDARHELGYEPTQGKSADNPSPSHSDKIEKAVERIKFSGNEGGQCQLEDNNRRAIIKERLAFEENIETPWSTKLSKDCHHSHCVRRGD